MEESQNGTVNSKENEQTATTCVSRMTLKHNVEPKEPRGQGSLPGDFTPQYLLIQIILITIGQRYP